MTTDKIINETEILKKEVESLKQEIKNIKNNQLNLKRKIQQHENNEYWEKNTIGYDLF